MIEHTAVSLQSYLDLVQNQVIVAYDCWRNNITEYNIDILPRLEMGSSATSLVHDSWRG